jgi:hypothetical protein
VDHQRNAGLVRGSDHRLGVGQRRREGLLADRRHLVASGKLDQRPMTADSRCDVDEIEAAIGEEVLGRGVAARDAEFVADGLQPCGIAIADGDDAGAFGLAPAMHLVDREEAAADQRAFQFRHRVIPSLRAASASPAAAAGAAPGPRRRRR